MVVVEVVARQVDSAIITVGLHTRRAEQENQRDPAWPLSRLLSLD